MDKEELEINNSIIEDTPEGRKKETWEKLKPSITEEERKKIIWDLYIEKRNKCLDEIKVEMNYAGLRPYHIIGQKIVVIVRKYGKEWDKIAEERKELFLLPDMFLQLMKKDLFKIFEGIDSINYAFKYL